MEDKDTELQKEKAAAEHGHAVSAPCEKCMGDYYYEEPKPFLGGSMSFNELRTYRDAQKTEGVYYMATLDYRDLSANILNDYELTIEEKASKLLALTQEFGTVVNNIDDYYEDYKEQDEEKRKESPLQKKMVKTAPPPKPDPSTDPAIKAGRRMNSGQVSKLQAALDTIKSVFSWAAYEEDEEPVEVTLEGKSGFKVFETSSGARWLSYSSNAFQDLEGELFTTAALEEAVKAADDTGDRGPLRIFHVPGADVGDADYQAIIGRFLVESGKFRDDELGTKAVEYFLANKDKEFQVSIGFSYKIGDEGDGVYDWVRIFERSVCPFGDAANPFTSFALSGEVGGKEMDERKREMLKDIFGEDLASKIVSKAESETKELEASVAFKTTELLDEVKGAVDAMPDGEEKTKMLSIVEKYSKKPNEKKDGKEDDKDEEETEAKSEEKPSEEKKEAPEPATDFAPVVAALEGLTEKLGSIETSVTSLQGEVKEIKEKQANSPRAANLFRATESDKNTVDPDKVKELTGSDDEDPPVNPVRSYIEDLFSGAPVRS